MGVRSSIGNALRRVIGDERTAKLRTGERRIRNGVARRLADPEPKPAPAPKPAPKPGRWLPSDPFSAHPAPVVTRHELLATLHERLEPRTYLEVGVNDGSSLVLSHTRSIGVDPAFAVRRELHADVQLVRATSDDFFARADAVAHFDGVPVDLAFIDGMHLSEFAFRDFVNLERHLARTAVVVFDDVLPRNGLEAARDRKTDAWAGDVYKALDALMRRRSDLVVLLVNTAPTGTAVVVGVDPSYTDGMADHDAELASFEQADPQNPPREWLERAVAVDPEALLGLPVWEELKRARETADADLSGIVAALRALPRYGDRVDAGGADGVADAGAAAGGAGDAGGVADGAGATEGAGGAGAAASAAGGAAGGGAAPAAANA
ncbi:class I SAM-dependent methyltransferase [Agromyces archimandritae]|uniref:Class I SAM-dependent methyltransferase n=1 Tax=Agromyces archimandritae TaxID=2781962 RepID=A0A975FJ46_9MICO|nr:class I SAM-dependent methyltransferase [Agromyces archimandritae]QTX03453.1 class I SAM-dependent methyltransferase [Agromyces archimandritae]